MDEADRRAIATARAQQKGLQARCLDRCRRDTLVQGCAHGVTLLVMTGRFGTSATPLGYATLRRTRRRRSVRRPAAINDLGRAGDAAGLVRAEVGDVG